MIYCQKRTKKKIIKQERRAESYLNEKMGKREDRENGQIKIINRKEMDEQRHTSNPKKSIQQKQEYYEQRNLDVALLFDKYQLLPTKTYEKIGWKGAKWNGKFKCNELKTKIIYRKFRGIDERLNRRNYQSQSKIRSRHKQKEQNRIIRMDNLQEINANQRKMNEQESQTKLTYCCESTTKTGSKSQFPTEKQLSDVSFHRNTQKCQLINEIPKNFRSKRQLPTFPKQDICNDAIPEQHEFSRTTSQSKGKRNSSQNKSSMSVNSKNSSKKSILKSSIFLPLQSIKNSTNNNILKEGEDLILAGYIIIEDYMQILNKMANYAQQIISIYDNTEDWQQLIFLAYKKYYLSRIKLWEALHQKNINFFKSLNENMSEQQKESLKQFLMSDDAEVLLKQVWRQNLKISDSLRNIYNIVIEKSGSYINLELVNNFSCEIYRLLIEQIQELKTNYYVSPDLVKRRFKNIIKFLHAMAIEDQKKGIQDEFDKLLKNNMNSSLSDRLIELIKIQFM